MRKQIMLFQKEIITTQMYSYKINKESFSDWLTNDNFEIKIIYVNGKFVRVEFPDEFLKEPYNQYQWKILAEIAAKIAEIEENGIHAK
jgi:hypothetical protein